MNGREMLRQTSAKQTNAQTQAGQSNKKMVEKMKEDAHCTISKSSSSSNGNNAKGSID